MNPQSSRSSLVAWGIVIFFFAVWEAGVRLFQVPTYLLPAPSHVADILIHNLDLYAGAAALTLGEALSGLLLGVLAGALLAALLTLLPGLEDGVMTLAILIKSTPLVAIAPLLTLWLGFGVLPKVIITALMTFFPVLVNILSGLQHVDPPLLDLFYSWNASRWEIFRFLRAPSCLPYLFAAIKISAPLALIGAVVAEWTGASGGLGRTMWLAYTNLNLPFLFAAIFILAAAGMLLYRAMAWAEQRAVFWQPRASNQ
ncbi:MAG: ABC transporter permease [Chloroflexi bacterium]|nr:ABC transporter permease [Anaerolineaceae bacterium]NMB90911.1 ABC transporter permease [Chloroflexota bacterium]